MPSAAHVASVTSAILDAYREATTSEPSNQDIISRAGVSSATYYRVVKENNEASVARQASSNAWRRGHDTGSSTGEDEADPILANPYAAVEELKSVIASLLAVVDDQRRIIERLQTGQQPDRTVVSIARDGRPPRPKHPVP